MDTLTRIEASNLTLSAVHDAHRAWQAADRAFWMQLVAEHGDDACNARYRPDQQSPVVRDLARKFHEAGERWVLLRNAHLAVGEG